MRKLLSVCLVAIGWSHVPVVFGAEAILYAGSIHSPLGQAVLTNTESGLLLTNLGLSGQDGITVPIGTTSGYKLRLALPPTWAPGASLTVASEGYAEIESGLVPTVAGVAFTQRLDGTNLMTPTYSQSGSNYWVTLCRGTTPVTPGAVCLSNGTSLIMGSYGSSVCVSWITDSATNVIGQTVRYGELMKVTIPGAGTYTADTVKTIYNCRPYFAPNSSWTNLVVTGAGLPSVEITGEWLVRSGAGVLVSSAGNSTLNVGPHGIAVGGLGATGSNGITLHLSDGPPEEPVESVQGQLDPLALIGPGQTFSLLATGMISSRQPLSLGVVKLTRTANRVEVICDFSALGAGGTRLEVYSNRLFVGRMLLSNAPIGFLSGEAPLNGFSLSGPGAPGYRLEFGAPFTFTANAGDGGTLVGDELRLIAPAPANEIVTLTDLTLTAGGVAEFTVRDASRALSWIQFDCPDSISGVATNPLGAEVSYSATAASTCDGEVGLNCSPASGSLFPIGRTVVTCNALNQCGATAECRFVVDVGEEPVRLQIRRAFPNDAIAWPRSSPGFKLQSTPTLAPLEWTDVTLPVEVVGEENMVTVPGPRLGSMYYRLARTMAGGNRSRVGVGVCTSTAPSSIAIPPGASLLSLPAAPLGLAGLAAVDGDRAYFWNPALAQWNNSSSVFDAGAWTPSLPALRPAEGFGYFRSAATGSSYSNQAAGFAPGFWGSSSALVGRTYLLGGGGLSGATFERIVDELPHFYQYVVVRRFDTATQAYLAPFTFADGRWSPEAPVLDAGEAAFFRFGPGTGPAASIQISGVTPSMVTGGLTSTAVEVVLTGRFPGGLPTLQLSKSFAPNAGAILTPASVQMSADRRVACAVFDFSAAGFGDYDVQINWPDGPGAVEMRRGLRLVDPGAIHHAVIGESVLANNPRNLTYTYAVTLHNPGVATDVAVRFHAASVAARNPSGNTGQKLSRFLDFGPANLGVLSGPTGSGTAATWIYTNIVLAAHRSTVLAVPITVNSSAVTPYEPTPSTPNRLPLAYVLEVSVRVDDSWSDPVWMPSFIVH